MRHRPPAIDRRLRTDVCTQAALAIAEAALADERSAAELQLRSAEAEVEAARAEAEAKVEAARAEAEARVEAARAEVLWLRTQHAESEEVRQAKTREYRQAYTQRFEESEVLFLESNVNRETETCALKVADHNHSIVCCSPVGFAPCPSQYKTISPAITI